MSPQLVLFDTQQWNYFVDPDSGPHPPGALSRLRGGVKAGTVEIVGSLDVLQELIEAGPRVRQKSEDMVEVFFDIVGPRLLRPLNERHVAEAVRGGVLSDAERYLNRERRRLVKELARSRNDVIDLAEELHSEKTKFEVHERGVQQQIREHLSVVGLDPTAALMRDWIREVDIDDWVADIAAAGNERGVYEIGEVVGASQARFPSAWAFTAFRLARLVATLGEGRKIQPSDLADAHHIASGPYVDLIVSDDRELHRTLELLDRALPCRVVPSAEFFGSLVRHDHSR